jgi:hypothetical protein
MTVQEFETAVDAVVIRDHHEMHAESIRGGVDGVRV